MRRLSPRALTLAATALGSSVAFIDATVVVVALPTIRDDLGFGLAGQQWIYLSYSLSLAALYLVSGALGDRYGRREVFVAGIVAFAAASVLCGIAPNLGVLIAARFLQGVGGAVLTTNSLALLREVYGDESGKAIGLWTSFTSLATIAGPPAGGALVEWVSWRWIFFLNLPIAAVTVLLALAGRCPSREQTRVGRMDVVGAGLVAVGLGALTYALVEGADRGLGAVWWAAALAVVALAAFVLWQQRAPEPLLPLGLFRRRNFAASNLATFLVYAALGGVLLWVPVYLQFIGFTPFEAGLALTPTSIVLILLAARFGALADRHGPRLYLTVGPALVGVGILLLMPVDAREDFWTFGIAGLVILAFGLAMLVAPITNTAISSAPAVQAGIASGVNQTVARVGQLIAVALIGLVISLVFEAQVDAPGAQPLGSEQTELQIREASVEGFRAGMILAAALAFAGAAVGGLGISNAEALGRGTPQPRTPSRRRSRSFVSRPPA
jgi:EmrB/QacA subfamily drug resistance transporter